MSLFLPFSAAGWTLNQIWFDAESYTMISGSFQEHVRGVRWAQHVWFNLEADNNPIQTALIRFLTTFDDTVP